jgi:hypothetical protein
MYRLLGSVGRGGLNACDDVLIVQRLLNRNAHLVPGICVLETGIMDEATLHAITAFQRGALCLSAPDGRVDPHGRTFRVLLGEQPQATGAAFVRLSEDSGNIYLYAQADRVWGTAATLQSLRTAAAAVRVHGFEVGVGDISFQQGGRMPPHGSHRRGVDVDIRPARQDGQRAPVTISDAQYSHERTKQLVAALRALPNLQSILFNDSKIDGVKYYEGHHNHLHVRFKA